MMDRKVAGLFALAIALPGAWITLSDFRSGKSRLWATGGVRPLTAERITSPVAFWVFSAINALLLVLILGAGLALEVA